MSSSTPADQTKSEQKPKLRNPHPPVSPLDARVWPRPLQAAFQRRAKLIGGFQCQSILTRTSSLAGSRGVLEPIPAVIGRKAGYTLDRSRVSVSGGTRQTGLQVSRLCTVIIQPPKSRCLRENSPGNVVEDEKTLLY
ncbi:hypothetical protein MHYP_G00144080 [Metynnis hypsauchen]